MKLTLHDKRMLLIVAGVMIMALSYLFVYRPQMEEAESIEASNISLQERLNEYLKLAENKDFYVEETNTMQAEIQEYCDQFPALVRPEDGIVLAQEMEKSLNMTISSASLGSSELIWYLNQGDSESSAPADTMMEQLNDTTKTQLEELEGTSEEETGADPTTNDTDTAETTGTAVYDPALYRIQDTFQFSCTYDSLKDAVTYLASQAGRMTLDSVTASFDSSTGNLSGTMTVNLYFMTGVNNTYDQPDAGSVTYGTDNIFGTLDSTSTTEYNLETDGDGVMDAYDADGDGVANTDGDGVMDAYDADGDDVADAADAASAETASVETASVETTSAETTAADTADGFTQQ